LLGTGKPEERSIDDLREDLTAKLGELHRRAVHAKAVVTPGTYLANPWLRLGAGLVAGAIVAQQVRRGGLLGALALTALGGAISRAVR
jgi:hypothetical protein